MKQAAHQPAFAARQAALWIFLLLNAVFALTSSGRVRTMDEVLPIFQIESLVERGSTAIPQATSSDLFYGKLDLRGQPRAPYPPGQAVAALPWHLPGRYVLARLPGVPAEARDIVADFATVLSSATFAALAAAVFFLLLCELGAPLRTAFFVTLLVALATPLFAYSAYFFSEPLATLLLLAAAGALFGTSGLEAVPAGRAIAGGALLGLLLWVRPTHIVAAPVFLFCLLASERKRCYRTTLLVAAVIGCFGLAHLARNYALFGDPLDFGYPAAAEGGKRLNSFETPLWVGLAGFLVSPGKSVFLFAPPILLALAGLRWLWRRNRDLAFVALVTPIAYLLFYSTYTQWEGGYCPGPRYLVPALVLLCLGCGPALAEGGTRMRRLALALFIAGVLVQGLSMATSFLEDQATGQYYDARWNYRLSYNPMVSQARLLWQHATSGETAPLGRGFDRWFVYLHKAGVSPLLLCLMAAIPAAVGTFATFRLKRLLADSPPPTEIH